MSSLGACTMVQPNRVLDTLHKATVFVLASSTIYFTVEIFRVSAAIQEARHKARKVRGAPL